MTPREEHDHACQEQNKCQHRLDEARRELNRQRRELNVAMPYDHQADERKRRLEPAREMFQQRLTELDAAKRGREAKFDAIPDKTDEDGGNYWGWTPPRQLTR